MNQRERIPPNQTITTKFPVLHVGSIPNITKEAWELKIEGLVENTFHLTFKAFLELPSTIDTSDFHCVTGWSRLDNKWEGVAFKTIKKLAKPKSSVKFVTIECYGGYSTSLPLKDLMKEDVLLAYKHEDRDLDLIHGGPVRLVVPKKYAYKSAKWVHKVIFTETQELGFWEKRGYSNTADPWKEDRYARF
ncbi:MAG: sulfite oxidase-like oxidoreductase [Candidatus Hodarchaeota archaeon]